MTTTVVYPEAAVSALITFATEHSTELDGVYFQSSGRINIEKDRLYLLLEGQIRIELRESERTLGIVLRKMVFGIVEQNYLLDDIYYSGSRHGRLLSVNTQKFYAMLNEHNLMINMVVVTSYFVAKLLEYYHAMLARNAYAVVKKLLERYVAYQQIQPDINETVVSFILTRSTLSRSMIMQIISDLRKGNYIQNSAAGELRLLRELPKNY